VVVHAPGACHLCIADEVIKSRHAASQSPLRGDELCRLPRHVEGTCRSEEKQELLRIRGFTAHRFNPDDDEGLRWVRTPLLCRPALDFCP